VVEGCREREIAKRAGRDLAPGSNVASAGLSGRPAVEGAGCLLPLADDHRRRPAGGRPGGRRSGG
jgi:hypothetical protein